MVVASGIAAVGLGPASAQEEATLLANASFETGDLAPWRQAAGTVQVVSGHAHGGGRALALGSGPSSVEQTVPVRPHLTYRLTGWLQSGSGAEEVRLGVKDYGGAERAVAVPSVAFRQVTVEFTTGPSARQAVVFVLHPTGDTTAYADDLELRYVGESAPETDRAPVGATNTITVLPARVPRTDQGITQQPDKALGWPRSDRCVRSRHTMSSRKSRSRLPSIPTGAC